MGIFVIMGGWGYKRGNMGYEGVKKQLEDYIVFIAKHCSFNFSGCGIPI